MNHVDGRPPAAPDERLGSTRDTTDPTPFPGTNSDLVGAADLDVLDGTGSIAVVLLGRPALVGHLDPADLADALDATDAGPVSDAEFESLKAAIMAR